MVLYLGLSHVTVKLSVRVAVITRLTRAGKSTFKLTHMIIVRPQFPTGCQLVASVTCHVSLSIGLLTTWQMAQSKWSKRERIHPRQKPQAFYNLILELIHSHFCHILFVEVSH